MEKEQLLKESYELLQKLAEEKTLELKLRLSVKKLIMEFETCEKFKSEVG